MTIARKAGELPSRSYSPYHFVERPCSVVKMNSKWSKNHHKEGEIVGIVPFILCSDRMLLFNSLGVD